MVNRKGAPALLALSVRDEWAVTIPGSAGPTGFDPLPTFKIGPINGWKAPESGLWLKP
jgi:hypothetical protein